MIHTDTNVYQALLQSSLSGFWMVDMKGKIIEINDAYCKMSGYSRQELLKMQVHDLEAIDGREDIKNRIHDVIRIGHANFESQHRTKGGKIIDVDVSIQYIPIDDGIFVGFIHDITDSKALSRVLQDSEMFLRETQKIGKLGTFTMNISTRKWQTSEVLDSILGISSDFNKTAEGLLELIHPDYKNDLISSYYAAVKNNGDFNKKHKIVRFDDKKVKWVHTIGRVKLDQENIPPVIICTVRDITEQKQREEELRLSKQQAEEKEQQYRSLSNNIPGMTYRAKEDWSVNVIINSELVCGYNPSLFLSGKLNWFELIIEEDKELVLSETSDLLKKPGSLHHEYRIRDRDNSIRYVADYKTSVFDQNNKFLGVDGIVLDITDKKRSELELIKAKEKAQESDRLKTAFIANISHEIRTPMNGFLGFIDLLKSTSHSREIQIKYLDSMKSSGDRMMGLLSNLIDISRIECCSAEISKTDFNIIKELEDLCSNYRKEAIKKGVELKFMKPEALNEIIVNADKNKVLSIISNLINNAVKFTNQGSIEYSVIIENSALEFHIRDSGIGIAENELEKIFEQFYFVGNALNRQHDGAGLGLSISKAYVEALGGRIWVESNFGKGTVFYVTIPLDRDAGN